MRYSIVPLKDTTLFNSTASMNSGLDEILYVEKTKPTAITRKLCRSLIQFHLGAMSYGTSVSGSRKFYLNLYATQPSELPLAYDVQVSPVSQSWAMGVGKYWNSPATTEGASWNYKTGKTVADAWKTGSEETYGGAWYSGSGDVCTQSFSYSSADLDVDVTSIVEKWIAGTYTNNGFIIKFTDTEETDNAEYGTLKFFSLDTETIYKPKLTLAYDNSVYTGSDVAGTLSSYDTVVYIKSLKPSYKVNSVERIEVFARDRYPTKTFVTSQSQYVDFKYLPSSSYYAVKDAYSGMYVIPFDDYSKVSCNSNGNYFVLDFKPLPTNRLYSFSFKVVRDDIVQYFDSDLIFKVVN